MQFGIKNWAGDAKANRNADLIAGLSLWALIVPQSIAYAKLAGAPSPISGLYAIIIVLPIYAVFASSRLLVPSPTTAVSATFAGFLLAMSGEPQATLAALVMGTAVAYLVFYFFKLGFLTNFISMPVSMGYLSGLSIIVIIGQIPALLGFEIPRAGVFAQILATFQNLGATNWVTASLSVLALGLFVGLPKIAPKIPAGLIVLALVILASWALRLSAGYGVSMVGVLPQGFPQITLPLIGLGDLAIVIPASIGLVVLASGEASVTAARLADESGQRVDMNQQFFAFGMGNFLGSIFGSILGTGASSASMVNAKSGAKTPMSLIWAALAALLTLFFLTGLFAYVPDAYLSALVIIAVWNMLAFRKIWGLFKLSKSEWFLAFLAQISVLVFGILNGLLLSMLINVLYYAYATSRIETSTFGRRGKSGETLLPTQMDGAVRLPENVLAIGLTEGQIFYASARDALLQASEILHKHPKAQKIILSLERMNAMDYTTYQLFSMFLHEWVGKGKTIYLTEIRSSKLEAQLKRMNFDDETVVMSETLDLDRVLG